MTLQEANALLDAAPRSDKPSRINKGLTQAEAVEIVRNGINGLTKSSATLGRKTNMELKPDKLADVPLLPAAL